MNFAQSVALGFLGFFGVVAAIFVWLALDTQNSIDRAVEWVREDKERKQIALGFLRLIEAHDPPGLRELTALACGGEVATRLIEACFADCAAGEYLERLREVRAMIVEL